MNTIRSVRKRLFRRHGPMRPATSISDNDTYPQFCLDATNDYRLFQVFRRQRDYNKILEHVTQEQGQQYLDLLSEDASLVEAMPEFARNDEVGSPLVFEYPRIGRVSPTTLRYVKVLGELKQRFGSLDGMRIAEIGVGYGGQCRVINAAFAPDEYHLIDLKPALGLAQRFLDHFVLNSTLVYRTMNELPLRDYDLVISNYAFTELPRPFQDRYFERVLARSARGYITYNDISPDSFDPYVVADFEKSIEGLEVELERPLIHAPGRLLTWGPPSR